MLGRITIIGCGLMGREFASASMRWSHLLDQDVEPRIVAVCDADGRIKMVLPGTATVLGWDPRSLNERFLWDFCHPDELEPARAAFELMTHKSNPSCCAMGRANLWRRPVTTTTSTPAAWARRRPAMSAAEI